MSAVLLVDTWAKGHHKVYAKGHVEALAGEDVYLVFPEKIDIPAKLHLVSISKQHFSLYEYIKVLREVNKIIKEKRPISIHFLTGDYLVRFFGFGLKTVGKKTKLVISFHQYRSSRIKNISIKRMCNSASIVIVHSKSVLDQFKQNNINNTVYLDYPCFDQVSQLSQELIRNKYGLDNSHYWIGFFGASRYDKGLDILLEAMSEVNENVSLLIAGKATDINEETILAYQQKNKNIHTVLRYLSDTEMSDLVNAVDAVVLPYRNFSGASGPLTIGVVHNKTIIGSNRGSINQLITDNELGMVFEAESSKDLASTINQAIIGVKRSKKYDEFRNRILLENYQKNYRKLILDAQKR